MNQDPIVDEVRRAGEAYLEKFNFDVRAAFEDLRRRSDQSGRTLVARRPKPARPLARKAGHA
jgi:hypothetical protein